MASFPTISAGWHRARLAVLRRRRPLAALCAGVAVVATLQAVRAEPPAVVPVRVAAHDLGAGSRIGADDLRVVDYVPGSVPDDVLADPVGHVLAGGLRAGTPITGAAVVGPALADPGAGSVAVPVRLPDAGLAALLRVGDVVDLMATDPQAGTTVPVASGVRVLALPAADPELAAGGSVAGPGGAAVVLGVPAALADDVTDAASRLFLSYVWAG